MKKYILKFLALAVALLIPFAAYYGYAQSLPAQFGGSIMGTVRHKIGLLQNTPSPRVILAGGSSSPYATNCEEIGQALGMPCINIGATAYLGVEFYLSMLEDAMRPGDVIVIAPEHSMLADAVDYQTVWSAVENFPEVWAVVPPGYWPAMATQYFQYGQAKLDLYKTQGDATPAYHADFGPLGDVTLERETLLEAGYIRDDPIALGPGTLDDGVVHALNRFAAKAEQAGATVYFAFAPVDKLAITTTPDQWQALEARIRNEINLPVLGTLPDAVMDGAYFYDSNNHLTTEGARLYSARLIDLLQAELLY
ncbi:MAG: hypothetical protein GXY32_00815 [Ruminococcaceae bacterium]|nr:hypothetical protein [Oscillospiraceae bacterium]